MISTWWELYFSTVISQHPVTYMHMIQFGGMCMCLSVKDNKRPPHDIHAHDSNLPSPTPNEVAVISVCAKNDRNTSGLSATPGETTSIPSYRANPKYDFVGDDMWMWLLDLLTQSCWCKPRVLLEHRRVLENAVMVLAWGLTVVIATLRQEQLSSSQRNAAIGHAM